MTPRLEALIGSNPLVMAAYALATGAHEGVGQKRPTLTNPDEPYINHPVEVAGIVAEVPGISVEAVIAALLHDVVEDTAVKITTIIRLFGELVGSYVLGLTDQYTPEIYPDMNRAARKALEAVRLGQQPPEVQTIKLADGLSNTPSIAENKPSFMPIYGPEKRAVWGKLIEGDPALWVRLDGVLRAHGF